MILTVKYLLIKDFKNKIYGKGLGLKYRKSIITSQWDVGLPLDPLWSERLVLGEGVGEGGDREHGPHTATPSLKCS